MLGLHVTVPITCWRKGMAREFLETELVPPPATIYGFLLSLVGETDRRRHLGARVTAGVVGNVEMSVVLRTVWRVKNKPLGSSGNTKPDYQQLLTGSSVTSPFVELIVWLDSANEIGVKPALEDRVRSALDRSQRGGIDRFGGLCLGESTHLVDSVSLINDDHLNRHSFVGQRVFLKSENGAMSLPIWVDHVGSAGTRHVVGDLVEQSGIVAPPPDRIPMILPD